MYSTTMTTTRSLLGWIAVSRCMLEQRLWICKDGIICRASIGCQVLLHLVIIVLLLLLLWTSSSTVRPQEGRRPYGCIVIVAVRWRIQRMQRGSAFVVSTPGKRRRRGKGGIMNHGRDMCASISCCVDCCGCCFCGERKTTCRGAAAVIFFVVRTTEKIRLVCLPTVVYVTGSCSMVPYHSLLPTQILVHSHKVCLHSLIHSLAQSPARSLSFSPNRLLSHITTHPATMEITRKIGCLSHPSWNYRLVQIIKRATLVLL